MGMDQMIYSFPKRYTKAFYKFDDLFKDRNDEWLEKHEAAYWRKYYGLNTLLMDRFKERSLTELEGADVYDYAHKIIKEDLLCLESAIESLDSVVYSFNMWCGLPKEDRKDIRKVQRKQIKHLFKEFKKGRNLFYVCSY